MGTMLILLILTSFHVVDGQEKSSQPTRHKDSASKIAQAAPAPPQAVNVINEQAAPIEENRTKEHPQSYLRRLFAPENLPNIGLVIVGVFGICVGLRTLKAIFKQIREMRRQRIVMVGQLRAIETQAKMQKEALRAHLTIGFKGNVFESILHDGHVEVAARFINTGGSPAYKVIPETWIEFCQWGFADFSEAARHHIGEPLVVYPTEPTMLGIPLARRASNGEIAGLRNAQMTLGIRIRLTYESVGEKYFVDRAFSAMPDGMQIHPKYNDAN